MTQIRVMKKIGLYFTLLVLLSNIHCGEAKTAKKETAVTNVAEIRFRSETINIGVIDGTTNANQDFSFTNTGNAPLTITEARGSCHCVQAKWPDKPIQPGDSAVISVSFDPIGVSGLFIRTLKVQSNATRPSIELSLTGDIKRDPNNKKDTKAVNPNGH
jgi:Protein of unknown function (DUF1573)